MVTNRAYYDAFSHHYDVGRGGGYHRLIDEQAAELVRRAGEGRSLLEVGCGTGLIQGRVARFAKAVTGVDVSPGMLSHARARGLSVVRGEVGSLPFADKTFDAVYAFKVLAHVPDLGLSLREMTRVVRPGGRIVFDVYNRRSLRALIKRGRGARATSESYDEHAIETRYETAADVTAVLPHDTRLVRTHGIRVLTPHPAALQLPGVGPLLERLEWRLMDSPWARFAGFLVYDLEKLG